MRSSFDTSRIFNDQDGWYVVMRESDEKNLVGPKHKIIGTQHLMGPFTNKLLVENWLEGFLAIYFVNRNPEISTINIQY